MATATRRVRRRRRPLRGTLLGLLALATALAVVPLLAGGPAAARPRYTPAAGPLFNEPTGTLAQQYTIFTHLNRTIDSTPRGSTIRIAVYSFAEGRTADKLIAAHRRGVRVRIVYNAHNVYPPLERLREALGGNRHRRSFAVMCEASCRGEGGNMHSKMFLFSRAGRASSVVMTGSANLTRHNARDQWSDLFTVRGNEPLYRSFLRVFAQMAADRPVPQPYVAVTSGQFKAQVLPQAQPTRRNDPVLRALRTIGCRGPARGYGYHNATLVRISMHAWNGIRGRYLAERVARLQRAGCRVAAILGVGTGRVVRNILGRAEVPVSFGTVRGVRTHEKVLLVDGVFGGDRRAKLVWTGSANWSDGSMRRDEVILRVDRAQAFERYYANWWHVWRHG